MNNFKNRFPIITNRIKKYLVTFNNKMGKSIDLLSTMHINFEEQMGILRITVDTISRNIQNIQTQFLDYDKITYDNIPILHYPYEEIYIEKNKLEKKRNLESDKEHPWIFDEIYQKEMGEKNSIYLDTFSKFILFYNPVSDKTYLVDSHKFSENHSNSYIIFDNHIKIIDDLQYDDGTYFDNYLITLLYKSLGKLNPKKNLTYDMTGDLQSSIMEIPGSAYSGQHGDVYNPGSIGYEEGPMTDELNYGRNPISYVDLDRLDDDIPFKPTSPDYSPTSPDARTDRESIQTGDLLQEDFEPISPDLSPTSGRPRSERESIQTGDLLQENIPVSMDNTSISSKVKDIESIQTELLREDERMSPLNLAESESIEITSDDPPNEGENVKVINLRPSKMSEPSQDILSTNTEDLESTTPSLDSLSINTGQSSEPSISLVPKISVKKKASKKLKLKKKKK